MVRVHDEQCGDCSHRGAQLGRLVPRPFLLTRCVLPTAFVVCCGAIVSDEDEPDDVEAEVDDDEVESEQGVLASNATLAVPSPPAPYT